MFLQHCSHLKDIIKDTAITDLSVFHNCVLKQKTLHAYLNFKFRAGLCSYIFVVKSVSEH